MTQQIDWVRAIFTGAMVGGFVWAVIAGLASLTFLELGWPARAAVVAVAVNAVVLAISWLLWRSATGEKRRTIAAALWVVPFLGIAFFVALYTIGLSYSALRSS